MAFRLHLSGKAKRRRPQPERPFRLREDPASDLGEDHPFLKDVAEDMIQLCHHLDAGDCGCQWLGSRR